MNSRAPIFLLAAVLLGLGGYFVLSGSGPDPGTGESGAAAATQAADDPADPVNTDLAAAKSAGADSASLGNRVAAEVEEAGEVEAPASTKSLEAVPSATLTGRVIDALGQGLGGVVLIATPQFFGTQPLERTLGAGGANGSTGPDGSFSLEVPFSGAIQLSVLAEGYERRIENLTLLPGQLFELFDLSLTRGCVLAGRVVDANGAPVSGAELNVSERTGQQVFAAFRTGLSREPDTTTDESGHFQLSHAPAGDWEVRVTHEDHPTKTFEGEAAEVGSTVSGLLFQLDRGSEIAGSIVGFVPGSELRVTAFDASAMGESSSGLQTLGRRQVKSCEVDADGTWILRGLKVDQDFDLELYENQPSGLGFNSISERAVQARAGDAGVALDYRPGWTLSMQVADSKTGEPIDDYRFLFGPQFSTQAAEPDAEPPFAEGRSSYSNLRMPSRAWFTGAPSARVEAQGYAARELEVPEMPSGGELELGKILLDPVPTLTVRVTDGESGEPVEGARVARSIRSSDDFELEGNVRRRVSFTTTIGADGQEVDWSPDSAVTDADGIAVLDGLPGERVDLSVTHKDYAPSRLEDLSLTDEPQEVAVELGLGGRVEVTVVDEAGLPVPGIEVSHNEGPTNTGVGLMIQDRFGVGRAVTTNSEGVVRFDRLPYGSHGFRIEEELALGSGSFMVFEDEMDSDWTEVLVTDSEPLQLQLVLEEKSEVTGRITQVGVPLVGASVSAAEDEPGAGAMAGMGGVMMIGGDSGVSTDEDGQYRLDGLEPGDYVLQIRHPSLALPARVPFTLVGRSERVDADLSINAVEGRVTDTNGEPLAGVVVKAELAAGGSQTISMVFTISGDSGPSGGVVRGGADTTVLTDADGRYRLEGLPADTVVHVLAEPPASLGAFTSAKSEPFQVGPEETLERMDIACPEGGAIRVLLDFGSDDPSPVILMARSEGQQPRTEMIQGRTEMLLEGLASGEWELTASRIGGSITLGGDGGETVEVVPGQTIDVTLVP